MNDMINTYYQNIFGTDELDQSQEINTEIILKDGVAFEGSIIEYFNNHFKNVDLSCAYKIDLNTNKNRFEVIHLNYNISTSAIFIKIKLVNKLNVHHSKIDEYFSKNFEEYSLSIDENRNIVLLYKSKDKYIPTSVRYFFRLPMILKKRILFGNPFFYDLEELENSLGSIQYISHLNINSILNYKDGFHSMKLFNKLKKEVKINLNKYTLSSQYIILNLYRLLEEQSFYRVMMYLKNESEIKKYTENINHVYRKNSNWLYAILNVIMQSKINQDFDKLFFDYCNMMKILKQKLIFPNVKSINGLKKHHDKVMLLLKKKHYRTVKKENLEIQYLDEQLELIQVLESKLKERFNNVKRLNSRLDNWLTKDMLLEKIYRPSQHYNGIFIKKLNEILEEEK